MSVIRNIVEVDPERRAQWLMPSAIRSVHPKWIRYLLPVQPGDTWHQGDLLLGEVQGLPGIISIVQNTNRSSALNYRDAALFPGSKLVAVLAPRAGSSTCIARVPDRPVEEIHLHGVGGQAGLIEPGSANTAMYRGQPTVLRVLAMLGGDEKQQLNTRQFGLSAPEGARKRSPADPALILVVGSDMDSGKTTTARRIIYSLRAMGHKVVAGKATGVGSLHDIASMFDAGASEVVDFAALGEPVTIELSQSEVLSLFHRIFNLLRKKAGPDGFVVMELADGIWYRETRFVMEDDDVRDLVSDLVLSCHGILDAKHGIAVLGTLGYAAKLRALSGKLGSSGVLRGLAPEHFGAIPVFDSMDYSRSPAEVAALFGSLPCPGDAGLRHP
jgi:hypothetical protein